MTEKEKKKAIFQTREILLSDLIRKHYQGNQTHFAKAIGKKQPQINRYFSKSEKKRSISDSFSYEVEKFFRLPIGWLSNPSNITSDYARMLEAQMRFKNDADIAISNDNNHIPLLPIKSAITYALSLSPTKINITDTIITPEYHSPKAFAITMPDQSMQSHKESISINKDDILLIEPSIAPQSGDFVFVVLDLTHNIATIAQLIISLHSRYLRQFNPFIELEITEHAKIIGVVTEKKTLLLNEFNLVQRLNTK